MKAQFVDVQRIVLNGGRRWRHARQLALGFADPAQPLRFMQGLMDRGCPSRSAGDEPTVQLSLGLTRRGLEHARVPAHVLSSLASKAPAFMAGAALRSASHLGHGGVDAAECWEEAFEFTALDAVLSLHSATLGPLDVETEAVEDLAKKTHVKVRRLPLASSLPAPDGEQWVHFGYRDALSRVGIEGWTSQSALAQCKAVSRHAAGEFVLGHRQNSGANPWLASAGQRVWASELRAFFNNGSFGVLHQLEQDVAEFEFFVFAAARAERMTVDEVKAKLCGRTPEGWPLAKPLCAHPDADFDYEFDPHGRACPFGGHVRRMNPRGDALAHSRPRPLLRRGMPYGPTWQHPPENKPRGLMAQFFCASIEDQFEHLIGQWAERVPLGSLDAGGARDPLIGAHEAGDGGFEIPMPDGPPRFLDGLSRFTRTRGLAYLFYPSVSALAQIARNRVFADLREDDE